MAATLATLADGQLTGSNADLYTVPASTMAAARMYFGNTSATTAYTVYVYVKRSGGTDRIVATLTINAGGYAEFPDGKPIALSTGDKLRGYASTTTVIDYIISGHTAPA